MRSLENQSGEESTVLEAVKNGSTEGLGLLYRRHAEMVFRLAGRITASREDAEDVLQDVFLGLPLALQRYREEGRFESWLKRVTVRTALMRMRAKGRKREDPMEALVEIAGADTEGREVDRIALRRILGEMPETLRAVFVLKEVEGYSHDEIGETLGITSGASATRLLRAWTFVREAAR
jgi:RNA polymerase sigma-70 factor, ECF subfamily